VSELQTSEQTEKSATIQVGNQTFRVDDSSTEELLTPILELPTSRQPEFDCLEFRVVSPWRLFVVAALIGWFVVLTPKIIWKIGLVPKPLDGWMEVLGAGAVLFSYIFCPLKRHRDFTLAIFAVGFLFFLAWIGLRVITDDRRLPNRDFVGFSFLWDYLSLVATQVITGQQIPAIVDNAFTSVCLFLLIAVVLIGFKSWYRILWNPDHYIRFDRRVGHTETNLPYGLKWPFDTIVGIQLIPRVRKSGYLLNLIVADAAILRVGNRYLPTEPLISFGDTDSARESGKLLADFLKVPLIDQIDTSR
jgi:hypothetical protein